MFSKSALTRSTALRFVLLVGIVNLFADFTYEGARSITGPYLGVLGARAAIVGLVAGAGELLGYVLRSASGYFADKTHEYWPVIFVGYAINMLAVPALALAGNWPLAALLIMAERTGRAIRRPNVETMISYTSREMGSGWVFGLNEAMDQGGATLGPLVVALVLYLKGGYRDAFAILLIPALLCLGTLALARYLHPRPQDLDTRTPRALSASNFSGSYWWYVAAGALIAAGFADFALIAFHFQQANVVPASVVPIFYAVAMAVGALSALVFGRLLDKIGVWAAALAFMASAFFAPFVFLGGFYLSLVGMVLWGIGLGVQDSVLKAMLTPIITPDRRSTAFGVFDTGFGIAWFLGSAAMGFLYQVSIPGLVVFSVVLQLAAAPVLLWAAKRK